MTPSVSRTIPNLGIRISRIPQALVFALLTGYCLAAVIAVSTHWYFDDADAYWNAALRLRAGQPLYVAGAASDPTVYRYAPWFAWGWVPLSYLPYPAVMALWGAVLVAAALWLLIPARMPAAVALAMLCFPDLLRVTSTGNVQPLLLAAVAWRTTSWMIGVAASLKPWALAFLVVHWRQPWRMALGMAVAAVLWLPALLYDLSAYPLERALFTPGTLSIFLVIAQLITRRPTPTRLAALR